MIRVGGLELWYSTNKGPVRLILVFTPANLVVTIP